MIDRTFIDRVAELAATDIHEIGDISYSTRSLHRIDPPAPETLTIHTLTGVVDYLKSGIDATETATVHIHDVDDVRIISHLIPPHEARHRYARATPLVEPFKFDTWYSIETFIIQMQSRFVPNEHSAAILRLVGNLTDSVISQYDDDGQTQSVTVKTGIARVESAPVPPRVTLQPFRTFLEITQPESEFVFRLKPGRGDMPEAALFEADGGRWKLDGIEGMRDWLAERLPTTTTIIA